ncbi:MAG: TIGR03619 family F420-dependent LLM class oxidoreductase [Mycobacterium sp.]
MKLGLGLPHYGAESTPERIAEFATYAEDLGYDSLWALERLLRPTRPKNAPWEGWRIPEYYADVFAPLETLTFVAGHTSRVRLGTSVIDALFHVPAMLARQLVTLDHFSGGRLDVGIGQGWSIDEFHTANIPWRRRGAGFEEFLEALRAVWQPDPVKFDGRFYRIPESQIGPKPLQVGGPPLLVGVMQDAVAPVERAGRLGLGLHPMPQEWRQFEQQVIAYRCALPEAAGPGRIVARVNNAVTEVPIPELGRPPFAGSPDQVGRDLLRAVDLGIDEVMWDLTQAQVPYDVQMRLLEPLVALRP